MKKLLKLVKFHSIQLDITYTDADNKYHVMASRNGEAHGFSLDAFDVSREFTNRELENSLCSNICYQFGIDESYNG